MEYDRDYIGYDDFYEIEDVLLDEIYTHEVDENRIGYLLDRLFVGDNWGLAKRYETFLYCVENASEYLGYLFDGCIGGFDFNMLDAKDRLLGKAIDGYNEYSELRHKAGIEFWHKPYDSIKILLEAGADPNKWGVSDAGLCMPLFKCRSLEVVKLLVEYGADPIKQEKEQKTTFERFWIDEANKEDYYDLYIGFDDLPEMVEYINNVKTKQILLSKIDTKGNLDKKKRRF